MPIKVTGLMHAGIRIAPKEDDVDKALALWQDLLGLEVDKKRPHIAGIPGFWINLAKGDRGQQIHVFGAKGKSPRAMSKKKDPTRPHVALTVEDIDSARRELESRKIKYWVFEGLVGRNSDQVFFEDGFGNMIELQQQPAPERARRPAALAAARTGVKSRTKPAAKPKPRAKAAAKPAARGKAAAATKQKARAKPAAKPKARGKAAAKPAARGKAAATTKPKARAKPAAKPKARGKAAAKPAARGKAAATTKPKARGKPAASAKLKPRTKASATPRARTRAAKS